MSAAAASAQVLPPRVRVRWRIFSFLFAFGLVGYFQRNNVPVAGVHMMPDLGLTQMQLAWLLDAFIAGYTIMQFPGGLLGQRFGARVMMVAISLTAVLATLATPLAPFLLGGTALFALLLAAQLLLGFSQGPIFPVSTGVFEAWFRPGQWSLVQGLQSMGANLGSALAPPLIAWLMTILDWRQALVWTAIPALALIAGWAWYARNTPEEHPAVTAAERAELEAPAAERVPGALSWRTVWALLSNRDVLLLTLSYVLMNYAFYLLANWCYLYLVQERHFTEIESGWLAAAPPLAAALGAGLGGKLGSYFGMRYGMRMGLRIVPLVALPAAGLLQYAAVGAPNGYLAVAALALCFGAVELTEGPYWAAIMNLAREDSMTAGGLLNTGGNVGGLIGTPLIGYLVQHQAWGTTFAVGTVCAIASGGAWLLIDPTRRAVPPGPAVPS
ncbi:MAG TPA: MFS transporter [Steroidobacteraceae bacterium]|nr:MFS transporter [Steroidobacteraceae bacterium]